MQFILVAFKEERKTENRQFLIKMTGYSLTFLSLTSYEITIMRATIMVNLVLSYVPYTSSNSSVGRALDLKTRDCGFDARARRPNNY